MSGHSLLHLQQGHALVEDEHPSSPEIKKTLTDLNAQWKDLYEKSMDKGHKLRQAADQHSLNKALADAQVCNILKYFGHLISSSNLFCNDNDSILRPNEMCKRK